MKYCIGFLMFCFMTVAMGCGSGGGDDGGGGYFSSSCSCYGNSGSTAPWQYPESSSPAGGPSDNPNAVVCYFYRPDNCLVCRKGSATQKCCTVPPTQQNDRRYGGPTPYTEYLIGRKYTHSSYRIDWHNLYPKKEDSSGYYDYYQSTATGRTTMGLHPGSTSLGCVTVKKENSCWDDIERIIARGSMTYRGSNYDGFLYVVT